MKPSHQIPIPPLRTDSDSEAEQRPLDFGLIRRLYAYTQPHAAKRNWLLFLVILRSIQLPSLVWAVGEVINGPIAHHDLRWTLIGASLYAVMAALTQFTFHFRQRLGLELGEIVVHDLRGDVFRHLQRMPMAFFNRTRLGRILSRFTSDIEAVRVGVQDVLFVGLVQGGQMFVSAALMLYYDATLFLFVLLLAPVIWTINRYFRQRFSVALRRNQESFSRVTSTVAEAVGGIRITQGFARQDVNAGVFKRLVLDHARYNLDTARTSAIFLPLLELNSQLFVAMLLLVGGYRVLSPDLHRPMGDLIQFFFLANLFFAPIQSLGNLYNQALTAMAGAERVFKLLDSPPEWEDLPDAIRLPRIDGRVEFHNVSFGYDPKRKVLHEISFVAEPGQTIALVGHTGSGKSTIINLIAKFYLPMAGEIYIDRREIRSIDSASLHRRMGIVLQQNFLFTGTVMENILVGRPDATPRQAIEAAETLDCADLIEALPEGYNTRVGERGSKLSLGQRQLVCFARAMLANPSILILDEATSSVDAMTEVRLQKALATLLTGRTSFVIAHRLSTISHANLVLVLDHGRIIERGTHAQLLAINGAYADLYWQFIQGGREE